MAGFVGMRMRSRVDGDMMVVVLDCHFMDEMGTLSCIKTALYTRVAMFGGKMKRSPILNRASIKLYYLYY